MEPKARHVLRFALVTALSATAAEALGLTYAFFPPVLAILLAASPGAPMRPKSLAVLVSVILLTMGTGLLLIPFLRHQPLLGVVLALLGLYAASWLMVHWRQDALGLFLATGFLLVSALGVLDEGLARLMIESLAGGMVLAVFFQWLTHPFLPGEEQPLPPKHPLPELERSKWLATRSVLVVFPVWMVALTDPFRWLAVLTKALTLGQQGSREDARYTGLEMVGATLLGGGLALLFWGLLGILPNLWILFLLALLVGLWGGAKIHGVRTSRFPPTFWMSALMTFWILLMPAIADSAAGKDVYQAFFLRFSLFLGVTLYAWFSMALLEEWRRRRRLRKEARGARAATSVQ